MDTHTSAHDVGDSHPTEQPRAFLEPLKEVERRHIERVLQEVRWNQRRAASILGITRWSLARRLRKYDLHPHAEEHA